MSEQKEKDAEERKPAPKKPRRVEGFEKLLEQVVKAPPMRKSEHANTSDRA